MSLYRGPVTADGDATTGGVGEPRRGRRPGTHDTRGRVLDAARALFARDGFSATTVRAVAAEAGVDASLVMQFFGSKQGLFAAVVQVPASVLERFDEVFRGPDEDLGERVVRAFLDVWEGVPAQSEPLMAVLRSAVANDLAREQLRGFIEARLQDGVRRRGRGGAGAEGAAALRAGVAASMLVGLVLGRHVVQVPTLAAAGREDLVRLAAPAVQAVLAGP
ncbi:TetR/AcrR family transcriptional regulator [Kineococcus rhizosphaerae]|uniref:TetR family transcriptional regulator n=1 Tax=Kineococcus rhizosphaerae TaxID=559628 RepID=A0A2T0R139_9ACTN|nr:TetR/AcrR family transcriptional regulator [Kineococcus rhizosphaerae]PRY13010.1 TetR family transcriptional regulator [Kineococcus rhizosphaerae]